MGVGRERAMRFAVLLGASLIVGACGLMPSSVDGVWVFVEFTVDGVTQNVVVGENTSEQPWVELDSGAMRGSSGCNHFSGTYQHKNGILQSSPGGTLMWCGDSAGSLMQFEAAFFRLMAEGGPTVTKRGSLMTWTGPEVALTLEQATPDPGR